jgi:hypothetical protein
MTTYNYKLLTWTENSDDPNVTYGKGGWEFKQAWKNLDSAIRRTNKVEGLHAAASLVFENEQQAS